MNNIRNFVSSNPMAALATAGAAGFLTGFAVSHILAKRSSDLLIDQVDAEYEEDEDEIDQLEFDFDDFNGDGHGLESVRVLNPKRDPSEIKVVPIETEDSVDDGIVMTSIFHSKDMDWDWGEEELKRSSSDIFTIHREEYFNQESGYGQSTLTYYAGDDILVDEQEVPIYNHKSIVGELEFGHGSDDPNVVYIRNKRLKGEYEVIKDDGLYQVEVLGHEVEKSFASRDGRQSTPKFRDE